MATVRISNEAHDRLAALASETGERMQTIVEEALAAYEDRRFWDEFTTGYERLASAPEAWADVQRERTGEAGSLPDDLELGR